MASAGKPRRKGTANSNCQSNVLAVCDRLNRAIEPGNVQSLFAFPWNQSQDSILVRKEPEISIVPILSGGGVDCANVLGTQGPNIQSTKAARIVVRYPPEPRTKGSRSVG